CVLTSAPHVVTLSRGTLTPKWPRASRCLTPEVIYHTPYDGNVDGGHGRDGTGHDRRKHDGPGQGRRAGGRWGDDRHGEGRTQGGRIDRGRRQAVARAAAEIRLRGLRDGLPVGVIVDEILKEVPGVFALEAWR